MAIDVEGIIRDTLVAQATPRVRELTTAYLSTHLDAKTNSVLEAQELERFVSEIVSHQVSVLTPSIVKEFLRAEIEKKVEALLNTPQMQKEITVLSRAFLLEELSRKIENLKDELEREARQEDADYEG